MARLPAWTAHRGAAAAAAALLAGMLGGAAPPIPTRTADAVSLPPSAPQVRSAPYDGRFTFVRVRYGGYGRGFGRGYGGDSWAHDYPDADRNMQTILQEVTTVSTALESSVVVDLEDRSIFRHPILYMSEPGFWGITDEGAKNLREHLLKGGFIIFDDFDGPGHWENWLTQIRHALPEYRPIEIGQEHPVFRTFFFVENIYVPNPMVRGLPKPTYLGIFEDNDPEKRMLALVNYNSDLAEYWEWSATGYLPIDPTNDAYRLGVNYFIWGLTH
jgi:hypothetical protein